MSNGFFSSFSSLFGGAPNGSSSRNGKAPSAFGTGYPSSSRRGPPGALDDAWSLPYNSPSAGRPSSAYPPSFTPSGYPAGTVNADSLANLASASSHTLVPQARPSLTEARAATGVSIPSTSFPPLRHTWNRIRSWSENSYPELKDTLNWPATEQQLDDLEYTIGFSLPPAVRESYLCHNGQELESNQSCQDGIFFGLPLLSTDQIAEEWQFWRAVDEDPTSGANLEVRQWQSSCPDKWVRAQYSCRGWIPLISDRVGNYIGVDLTPHPSGGGAPGQVIIFGRDFDTKVVMWRGEGEGGWGRFLQYVAEEFESGELWTLEEPSSGSEDEEDAIGYESYFSNGGAGASRGGGDRGGEGSAGFRLTGEYRGWPVLEAWADRSMRCWEEVGLPSGLSASEEVNPSGVRFHVDSMDAYNGEGSVNASFDTNDSIEVEVQGPDDHPLREGTTSPPGSSDQLNGGLHMQANGRPFSPSSDSGPSSLSAPQERRVGDHLSPPAPSTKASRSKQKQRAASPSSVPGSPSPSAGGSARPRRAPPAPAAPIDLPTIDDVKAVQAAALAEHERSARVQYSDLEQSSSGGGGGGGMNGIVGTMGSLRLGRNGTLRAGGTGSPSSRRGLARSEAVELDNRSSADALRLGEAGSRTSRGSLNDVVVVGEPRASLHSPTVLSPRSSTERRNYFEPPQSPNLMDVSSMPNSPNLRSSVEEMGASGAGYTASPLGRALTGSGSGSSTPTRQPPKARQDAGALMHARTNSIKGAAVQSGGGGQSAAGVEPFQAQEQTA